MLLQGLTVTIPGSAPLLAPILRHAHSGGGAARRGRTGGGAGGSWPGDINMIDIIIALIKYPKR